MINVIGDICLGLSLAILFVAKVVFVTAVVIFIVKLTVAVIDKILED